MMHTMELLFLWFLFYYDFVNCVYVFFRTFWHKLRLTDITEWKQQNKGNVQIKWPNKIKAQFTYIISLLDTFVFIYGSLSQPYTHTWSMKNESVFFFLTWSCLNIILSSCYVYFLVWWQIQKSIFPTPSSSIFFDTARHFQSCYML